jgi:acetoin utilization protein AcuC
MAPGRLELTLALVRDLDVFAGRSVRFAAPRPADDSLLQLVHDPAYVAAVRAAPRRRDDPAFAEFGLGGDDNPVFDRMHEASALVTGGTVDAARAVLTGDAQHAVNLAGGLHHAMPARASGFCVYNDAAVAIAWLLAAGIRRVAYVDVDAHHGDGVEAAFYDDPRVLTISLHESGYYAFPGSGFPHEVGGGEAEGMAINVALPPHTGDTGWLRAFHAVVPPLVRNFAPEILLTQLGCDTHRLDPLAQLDLTVDAHRHSYAALHELAHEVADGRWVAVGGGGYEIAQVVPRSWTHALAEIAGASLAPHTETPAGWRRLVEERTGQQAPRLLTDGADATYRPWDAGEGDRDDPVDRAIAATRRAVFPEHGLDHLDPR